MWEQFKRARNQANNAIKYAKKRYFSDNLEASKGNRRKTWNLTNELSSRNTSKSYNILEIQVDNRTISTPGDMAGAFNEHFTNIAQVLAQEVPAAEVDPEFYLSYTDKTFCLKTPSADVVFSLFQKIDEKKATGFDMIPSNLFKIAASIVNNLTCWLRANRLSLNVAKTELMIIGSRQRLNAQCEEIDINIDNRTIRRADHTKSLGLTIDAQLSWSKHVDEICKKTSSAIGALKRVRPFISKDDAVQIYNALVLPHFDYCSPVWDCMRGYLSDKLQKLQNRAARVITKSPFDTKSNLLLAMLKWEKLPLRRKKQKALIMYKTLPE